MKINTSLPESAEMPKVYTDEMKADDCWKACMQTAGAEAAVEAIQLYSPTGSCYLSLYLLQFGECQPRKDLSTKHTEYFSA